jgi:hypothetical protein
VADGDFVEEAAGEERSKWNSIRRSFRLFDRFVPQSLNRLRRQTCPGRRMSIRDHDL